MASAQPGIFAKSGRGMPDRLTELSRPGGGAECFAPPPDWLASLPE
jgi:hypothetical protein